MNSARTSWFATFAAGFGPLVATLVLRDVPGARVIALEDNAIRFESEREPRAVLAYCRSLFRFLGERQAASPARLSARQTTDTARSLEDAAFTFARDGAVLSGIRRPSRPASQRPRAGAAITGAGPNSERFVLRVFGPDDPESLSREARSALESAIAASSGCRPDPRGGAHAREFRLQARASGSVLFLERDRRGGSDEPTMRRGELPRTTCRLLAEMTEPRREDVFLDPFCGYGGIALERALAAPFRFVFAQDVDSDKVFAVKEVLRGKSFERRRKTIFPKIRDALDRDAFEPGFVDAIATDPPWGLYEGGPGAEDSGALLDSFVRRAAVLLGPGGRLVLLVSRELRDRALAAARESFEPRVSYDVLVSGRKASALRFDRPSAANTPTASDVTPSAPTWTQSMPLE